MEKLKTRFLCQECGYSCSRWLGKCPSCGQWDKLVEEVVSVSSGKREKVGQNSVVQLLEDIKVGGCGHIPVGITEFDRLLGGGIVSGGVILLGGEPGVGKSTLLMQVACSVADNEMGALYITGEESVEQSKMRAKRLNHEHSKLLLLNETNLDSICGHLEKIKPKIAIIDSIQIIYHPGLSSAPGSVAQVRECAASLVSIAKKNRISLILVGHITKNGAIAGPRVVEHLVDTVLYFEGDNHHKYRILRSVKNRFGSTDEIGIFTMCSDGLKEVTNPSAIFLNERCDKVSGSAVVSALEGTRPILVEIQALVSPTIYGMPERRTTGFDHRRLAILLAVLEKRVGLRLQGQDVFVNIVGGVRLFEPAIDLGVVLAIVSSFREKPIPPKTIAIGEVGLGGEIRAVNQINRRIGESKRLGFNTIILPRGNVGEISDSSDLDIVSVNTVSEAVEHLMDVN